MTVTFKSEYVRGALDPAMVLRRARAAMPFGGFDTLVGTGMSGLLPLQSLAADFGCHYLAIRKPGESTHSDSLAEGTLGHSWLFVDDFISSGQTFLRVKNTIDQLVALTQNHLTGCVGAFLYDELEFNRFYGLPDLRCKFPDIDDAYRYERGLPRVL